MANLKRSASSLNAKAVTVMLVAQTVGVVRDHWQGLDPYDRRRLTELLKSSKGRPTALTPDQRSELTEILKRLELTRLGRDLAPLAAKRATKSKNPLRRA